MPIPVIGAAIGIAGVASSVFGSIMSANSADDALDAQNAYNEKMAAENAKISREDARIARETAKSITIAGNQELALKINQIKRLKSQTKSGYASRGVAVNTGSALNQQESTLDAIHKDMKVIAFNTRKQQRKALSAASRYEMLADAGLRGAADQARAYEEALSAQKTNLWTETGVGAITSIAKMYNQGVFDDLFNTASITAPTSANVNAGLMTGAEAGHISAAGGTY
jgi:expansin (peptidoglycan-binding protein)